MTSDVLEAWMMRHLSAWTWTRARAGMHHGLVMVWDGCSSLIITTSIVARVVFIVVVSATSFVRKVLRSLVFMCAAVL